LSSFAILIQLGHVPEGWHVTKPTGEKQYLVKNSLALYYDQSSDLSETRPAPVTCPEHHRFLVAEDGSATITPVSRVVKITVVGFEALENLVGDLRAQSPIEEETQQ
jgi:hypothetical protein